MSELTRPLVKKSESAPDHPTETSERESESAEQEPIGQSWFRQSIAASGSLPPTDPTGSQLLLQGSLLSLQRTIGNQAVVQLLRQYSSCLACDARRSASEPTGVAEEAVSPVLSRALAEETSDSPEMTNADLAAPGRDSRRSTRSSRATGTVARSPASVGSVSRPIARQCSGGSGDAARCRCRRCARRADGGAIARTMAQNHRRHHTPPLVQRALSFVVKETSTTGQIDKDTLLKRPIVHLDLGERVDDRSRAEGAGKVCKPGENLRHVVGYDLIGMALKNMVRGQVADDVREWLTKNDSWVDKANADTDRRGLGPSLPGLEAGLTGWLKNATSFPDNLFCGSGKINKRKGLAVARHRQAIKQSWKQQLTDDQYVPLTAITSLDAVEKRTGHSIPFYLNDQLRDTAMGQADITAVLTGNIRFLRASALPGSQLVAIINGTGYRAGSLAMMAEDRAVAGSVTTGGAVLPVGGLPLGGAVAVGNKRPAETDREATKKLRTTAPVRNWQVIVKRVSRGFGGARTTHDPAEEQVGFLANQIDLDESKGYAAEYKPSLQSLAVIDPNGKKKMLGVAGLGPSGGKYFPPSLPNSGYHKAADKSATINLKRVEPGGNVRRRAARPADPRWGHLVQRLVHVDVARGKDAPNPVGEEIVSVNLSGRPDFIESRVPAPTKKFQHRRHRVGYDLLARGLARLFKGATVEQAAVWLDNERNWLDQTHLKEDRVPLLNGKTIRALSAVEAMANNWLLNAFNNPDNVFYGDKKVNMRKGRGVHPSRQRVKETWETTPVPLGDVVVVVCLDRQTESNIPFEYGGNSVEHVMGAQLQADAVHGKNLRAIPGSVLQIQAKGVQYRWGAAYVYTGTGGAMIKRVSRFHKQIASPDREKLRQTYVAHQIDTEEPKNLADTSAYPESYESHLKKFKLPSLHTVEEFVNGVNARLNGKPLMLNPHLFEIIRDSRYPTSHDKVTAVIFVLQQNGIKDPTVLNAVPDMVKETVRQLEVKPWAREAGKIKGLAEWALDHGETGKYRPGMVIPKDFHREADRESRIRGAAEENIATWRTRGRRIVKLQLPLLTTVLDADDVTAILTHFATKKFEPKIYKWVSTTLRGKNGAESQRAFDDKVTNARTVPDSRKAILKTAIADAVTFGLLRFPQG